jgi:hypothetical protein
MALRFLQGLFMGGALPVAASYVNELAPVRTRGRFFSSYQFLMVAGFPSRVGSPRSSPRIRLAPAVRDRRAADAVRAAAVVAVPGLAALAQPREGLRRGGRRNPAARRASRASGPSWKR